MTYCVGLVLDGGLVLASDSRTNAGVDYVTTFSKLHVFNPMPERIFVVLSAGNLATTQEVLNRIRRDLDHPPEGLHLLNANYLFEAVGYVGKVSLAVQREHGPALNQSGVSAETTLIVGGQIEGEPHGLFLVYPQGNYFAASPETPYLQIGESKYGKPALDRIAKPEMSLEDGARLCLVSLDATSRSNVTVGPPFEIVICPRDRMTITRRLKLDADDPVLKEMSQTWNLGIRNAFCSLPRFLWEGPAAKSIPTSISPVSSGTGF